MLWGIALDLTRNPIKTIFQQMPQTPPSTITSKHIQIMNMIIPISVSITNLTAINMRQPIIRNNLPRSIQHKPSKTITLIRISIHPPIQFIQILRNSFINLNNNIFTLPRLAAFPPIKNISLSNISISLLNQNFLNKILNFFNIRNPRFINRFQFLKNNFTQIFSRIITITFSIIFNSISRIKNRFCNPTQIKINNSTITFLYFINKHDFLGFKK